MRSYPLIGFVLLTMFGSSVSAQTPTTPLTDTHWILASVGGNPAEEGRRETFLTFKPDGGVAGSTGCNTLGAVYTSDGDLLSFSPVMTTRMYCQEVAKTEQALLIAMDDTRRYVIDGETLQLVSGGGTTLATFEAADSPAD